MSGRYRSEGKVIEILDKLFVAKKRSILYALVAAAAVYVLMLLLGHREYLFTAIVRPPVMGLLAFVGAFMTLGVMLALPFVRPKLMDIVEGAVVIAAVVLVALGAVSGIIGIVSGGFYNAASTAAEGAGLWCAVCLIHGVRE